MGRRSTKHRERDSAPRDSRNSRNSPKFSLPDGCAGRSLLTSRSGYDVTNNPRGSTSLVAPGTNSVTTSVLGRAAGRAKGERRVGFGEDSHRTITRVEDYPSTSGYRDPKPRTKTNIEVIGSSDESKSWSKMSSYDDSPRPELEAPGKTKSWSKMSGYGAGPVNQRHDESIMLAQELGKESQKAQLQNKRDSGSPKGILKNKHEKRFKKRDINNGSGSDSSPGRAQRARSAFQRHRRTSNRRSSSRPRNKSVPVETEEAYLPNREEAPDAPMVRMSTLERRPRRRTRECQVGCAIM